MLVVDPSSVATSPPVMTCSSCCVLEVPCLASLSALSFPGISQCPGLHWMDVYTSFWLCSLLAVVSMSVTIGCLWRFICAIAFRADPYTCRWFQLPSFFSMCAGYALLALITMRCGHRVG